MVVGIGPFVGSGWNCSDPFCHIYNNAGDKKMITIVGRDNGVGLTKDRDILVRVLKDYSPQFRSIDTWHPLSPGYDISIFTEIVDPKYYSKYNILIPNQEWFYRHWISELKNFQAIYVKTQLAYNIFKPMHPNVKYIGFTSIDMYREVPKKAECFHAQGKSMDKGTDLLTRWTKEMPLLHLLAPKNYKRLPNVKTYRNRLEQNEFEQLANQSLIHVCPSTMEGFGHYINEAKSMASVVITTDAPPMNEMIKDKRFLCAVKSSRHKESCLGTWTWTNYSEIQRVMREILSLELVEIGKQNRVEFLKDKEDFEQRLLHEIKGI